MPLQRVIAGRHRTVVEKLAGSKAMCRLAGFQNGTHGSFIVTGHSCDSEALTNPLEAFKAFFPKIHAYYDASLSKLYSQRPTLKRPYESSIMPAAAYNLGPATVCRPHRDYANLSFGICAITALGQFNPNTGGHLVLRELGIVTEFPPGATVLIPSAVVTHYNAKIEKGETRYSFTQFAAGSLFSFIDNGMRSEKDVVGDTNFGDEERFRHAETRRHRWEKSLTLFSHISEYADNTTCV